MVIPFFGEEGCLQGVPRKLGTSFAPASTLPSLIVGDNYLILSKISVYLWEVLPIDKHLKY